MIDLKDLNIKKIHNLFTSGELKCVDLVSAYLDNIKQHNKDLNAFLEVFEEEALKKAKEVDKRTKEGSLAGLPMAIKDNILIKNKKCTAGSKILENFIAPYDATVVEKLEKEGVIFLGKTNLDEFAMGSSTENSAFGVTKNPYDLERVAGGSSGGSVAAVASQMCAVALGSDTGGSIREPAAFCGVVGLKPTYGAVSRNGLIAMASSLDQIGPIARTVEDAEIIFNAIKGKDLLDSTSVDLKIKKLKIKNFVIGVPEEIYSFEKGNEDLEESVLKAFEKAIEFFKSSGFEVKQIKLPTLKYAIEVYYIIMPAEVSSNLARFDGIKYGFSKKGKDLLEGYLKTRKEGFGEEARRRVFLGTYVLSAGYYDAYYDHAQKVRNLMRKEFENTFKDVDVILMPTAPSPAFKIGEKTEDPVQMYLADIFTTAANLTGVPAISLPAKTESLPVGIQLMAPWHEEEKLFELGRIFEQNF